jgi:hypothetical protein
MKTKQQLLEEFRTINVDYDDWAEHIYDWFEEYLKERGITWSWRDGTKKSRDMSWSGFWSQGDGFAFGGELRNQDFRIYASEKKYPMIHKFLDEGGYVKMWWETQSRNNHRSEIHTEGEVFGQILEEDHPFVEMWDDLLQKEMERLESDLDEDVDSLCYMMYKKLSDEYDSLTSDEAVWDTIVCNDLDKQLEERVA